MSEQNPTPQPAQGESLILGKFKTADDLAKSYQSLEAELTKVKSTPAPQPAKLDVTKWAEEYASNGKLSDDAYKALEGVGISKEYVEAYFAGQKAQAELTEVQSESLLQIVGGKENLEAVKLWALRNMPEKDVAALNKTFETGSYTEVRDALTKLHQSFVNAVGSRPATRLGGAPTSPVNKFDSKAQMMDAMGDSRYERDPAYRQAVIEAVRNSDF